MLDARGDLKQSIARFNRWGSERIRREVLAYKAEYERNKTMLHEHQELEHKKSGGPVPTKTGPPL